MPNPQPQAGAAIAQTCPSCDKMYALSPADARPVMLQCLHKYCVGCVTKFQKEGKNIKGGALGAGGAISINAFNDTPVPSKSRFHFQLVGLGMKRSMKGSVGGAGGAQDGGGAGAAKPESGKRKRGHSTSRGKGGKGRASKKSKTGTTSAEPVEVAWNCISPGCTKSVTCSVAELPVETVSLRVHGSAPSSAKIICGACEDDAATTWCKDCSKWACDDCVHPLKGKFKTHTLVPIEEQLASPDANTAAAIPDVMCWKHPDQPIKVYCGDCGIAACLQCAVTQHNGHSILELEAAKGEQLPVMASLVTAVQEGVPKAAAAVAELQGAVKQLRANKDAADAAVEASFRKKAQVLLARKKRVLASIETLEAEKRQVLEDRITTIETTTLSSEGGTAVAECILEHGSPAEIMIARPSLTTGLGNLIKEHQALFAPTHKDIKLDFVDNMPDLTAQLDAFGKIAAARVDAAQCTVVGAGAGLDGRAVKAGATFGFTIAVVDDDGANVENLVQFATATLYLLDRSTVAANVQLAAGSEGGVTGTCVAPATAGEYSLAVTVDGAHVQGSPFALNVTTLVEFSGIKIESDGVSAKELIASGWTLAYAKTYSHHTKVAELDALHGTKCLVAARKTGADILTVAAMGDRDQVLRRTTSRTEAHEHNGAHWYCFERKSFGFAPNGTVNVCSADAHDQDSPHRLSWFIDGSYGGWRAGSACGLSGSAEWEKLIFTFN